ncbi:MAG: hypothetical protein WB566_13815 [Terriglobales bacterium]
MKTKRNELVLLSLVATVLMLGGNAFAQCIAVGDPTVYFTTYYSKANTAAVPDQTLRVINDGGNGNLWADIYVLDDSEELQECCSCQITPDGLLSESVNLNLTANPLTGRKPTRGVIKVISSSSGDPANPIPTIGLRVWASHVQGTKVTLSPGNQVIPAVSGPYFVTETLAAESNLSTGPGSEEELLGLLCYYSSFPLSGQPCSCTQEDMDF